MKLVQLVGCGTLMAAGVACSLDTEQFSFDREDATGGSGGGTGGSGGSGATGGGGGSVSCEPNTVTCSDDSTVLTCDADGNGTETACEGDTPVCEGGECITCVDDSVQCSGVIAQSCDGGDWVDVETCTGVLGCSLGECLEVVDIGAGVGHTCAVLSNGTVRCWGYNDLALLNLDALDDGPAPPGTFTATPTPIPGLDNAVEVDGGDAHTCVRTSDATVSCWGYNGLGMLGTGDIVDHAEPIEVAGLTGVNDMGAGLLHTCVVAGTGQVSCWGLNEHGQIGNGQSGSMLTQLTPVEIDIFGTTVAHVSPGGDHTLAVVVGTDGIGWGSNSFGQVGNGSNVDQLTPIDITGDGTVLIEAGGNHGCLTSFDQNRLYCWGLNNSGQLGLGTTGPNELSPAQTSITGVIGVFPSFGNHTCIINTASQVRCFGRNVEGQIGNGVTANTQLNPFTVPIGTVEDVAVGYSHSCALTTEGRVFCWGLNNQGQLGDGTQTMRTDPVEVVW